MAYESLDVIEQSSGVSRRGFLKSALVSAGLVSLAQYEAVAQMVGGPSARSVRGYGVPAGLVKISGNENALGPSPRAVEAILGMTSSVNRYGLAPDLYRKIARRHGLPEVDADSPFALPKNAWLSVGAGSSEILYTIAHMYFKEGDELVEVEPGFKFMARLGPQKGVKVVDVPLTADFRPDLSAMRNAINHKTKMVVVTTPGNPNGRLTHMEALKPFIESIPSSVVILVDEAYIDFARNPMDRIGAAPLIKDHPNVIVTRTFSKIYGMAGMRVGYALAQPDVINLLNSSRGNSLSVLSGYAASAAMDDHDYVRRSRELVFDGKDYFYKELDAMGVEYIPSESSFILINVRQDADTVVDRLFQEYNVLVGNANARWGIDNYIRVTAGLPEENEVFIAALKKVLVAS